MNKLIVTKDSIELIPLTEEELSQRELERQQAEDQAILDSLLPTEKEMLMAEVEIQTITILMEVGLL